MEVRTYCGSCGDSGTITVWHPETLSALKRGVDPPRLIEAAVACTCRQGDAYTTRIRSGNHVKWLDRYGDKQWHCKRTIREKGRLFNPRQDVEEFGTKALKSFVDNRPQNYVASFDEWNGE